MRINGFTQIKAFYSWVFDNQELNIKPQHISLYLFLLNQNNRVNWVEWFKCPFDLAMYGSCISSKKTYYSCLNDLTEWKMIQHKKGINKWKAPLIKLEVLKDTATVPQSEPQPEQVSEPLSTLLPTHIYKLLTDNHKQLVSVIEKWDLDRKEDVDVSSSPYDTFKNQIYKEGNTEWALGFYRKFKIRELTLSKLMDDFILHRSCQPEEAPKTLKDFKYHFYNWCNRVEPEGKLNAYKISKQKEKGAL